MSKKLRIINCEPKWPVQNFISEVEPNMLSVNDVRTKWIIESAPLFESLVNNFLSEKKNIRYFPMRMI